MLVAITFWVFLASALLIVFWFGQKTERAFAVVLTFATVLTFVFNARFGFNGAQGYILVVNCFVLVVVLTIMAKSQTFWPIWFASFQAVAVATGLASLLFPGRVPGIYINAAGLWALPALLTFVAGTMLDHRMRSDIRLQRSREL